MSTVEKSMPPAWPVWTSWSPDGKRLGRWFARPSISQLAEGGTVTADYPDGRRSAWRVYGWRLVDEAELLEGIKVPSNPVFGSLAGESTS